jgi:hypothetical protein
MAAMYVAVASTSGSGPDTRRCQIPVTSVRRPLRREPGHYQAAESLAEELLVHGAELGAVEVQPPQQRCTAAHSSADNS